jgi:hypothetical protein
MVSILAGSLLGYVDSQNMTIATATGVSMTNSTSDGDGTGGDEKVSGSDPEEDKPGGIANAPPKCLGSALCPD